MYAERYPRKWFGGCPVEDTWEAVVNVAGHGFTKDILYLL